MLRLKPLGKNDLFDKIEQYNPEFTFDREKALRDLEYQNEVLIEYNTYLQKTFIKKNKVYKYYALTLTTPDYEDPKNLIKRVNRLVQELPYVYEVQGNIELQPEGKRPHLHALIKTTATLSQKKNQLSPA